MKNAGWMFTLVPVALLGCADEPSEITTALRVDQLELGSGGTPYFASGTLGRAASTQLATAAEAQAALAEVLPALAETLGTGRKALR